jgi:hypothetical protein
MICVRFIKLPNHFGFNDLLSGAAMVAGLFNEKPVHYELLERIPDVEFTPDALANDGIR